MLILIFALVLGFLTASKNLLPPIIKNKMSLISACALGLLLFSLGLSLGSNPNLILNLPTLGFKALLLSLGAICGSVFFVWLAVKFKKGESK